MPKLKLFAFTDAEVNQLRSYVEHCETDGWYYGTEKQFFARHERIKKQLGMTEQPKETDE